MKQLYYTLLTLLRGRNSTLIKVISLSLGLFVGVLLFSRIAFELSYNRGYKEADKLSNIMATYHRNGVPDQPVQVVYFPVPATIIEHFPDEVESATVTRLHGETRFDVGSKRFKGETVWADASFFHTMGITVASGDVKELAIANIAFVSEEFARKAFGTTDVAGYTMLQNGNEELTIRGTFVNPNENNSVRPDVAVAIDTYNHGRVWGRADSYSGFVRLKSAADIEKINQRIDVVIEQYMPFNQESGVRYHLENIHKEYVSKADIKRIVTIMTFLAVAVLLIAAMNYILIAISGLSKRARSAGVHKCNGASVNEVFSMFQWETFLILLLSLIVAIVLILNFINPIQDILSVKLVSLFSLQKLWIPLLIIFVIFVVAGIIPGRIFANIPVTHVFHKYTKGNSVWKRILLFIQFTGVAFVFGLLIVVFLQYYRLINFNLGYDIKNKAEVTLRTKNKELAFQTIKNLPMVEDAVLSMSTVGAGYSGELAKKEDGTRFSTRFNIVTSEFIPFYNIKILEGRNILAQGEAVVNKEYIRLMGWTDGAIGKQSGSFGTIVGVMDDFVSNSLFQGTSPVLFSSSKEWDFLVSDMSVKLREPFDESLVRLNQEVKEIFPTDDMIFTSIEKRIQNKYLSVRRFRDSAGIAFVAIFLIAVMGLLGYVNDEIQRRSKEIAIRKVNGAEIWSIIKLLCREVAIVALPAVVIGIVISYFISKEWLSQFAGAQTELNGIFYILLSVSIFVIILTCAITKSWNIAKENPVKSIVNE